MSSNRVRLMLVVAGVVLAAGNAVGLAQGTAAPATEQKTPSATTTETKPAAGGATAPGFLESLAALGPAERMYFQHNATLSNPFFEGRAPGLRGNELAAEYCEFYFKKFELEPVFAAAAAAPEGASGAATPAEGAAAAEGASTERSYQQRFRAGSRMVLSEHVFELTLPTGAAGPMVVGRDFTVTPQSADGEASGELVWVGYSIERGPDGYSDYLDGEGKDTAAADLTGKIAVVLRLEPKKADGKSAWAKENETWSDNSRLSGKLRRAVQRGAAGVIVVSPPGADDPKLHALDDIRTGARQMGRVQEVPVIQVSMERAAAICAAAGKNLDALTAAADKGGGIVPLTGVTARIKAESKSEPTWSHNVAGVLRGKGSLADQYIVIGGHFDHVGYGTFGSRDAAGAGKLHPGADDNASGTAGVLVAAEMMAKQYRELPKDAAARSIIFVAFSAEEGGLIGSRFMARNMPVPKGSVYAMLNMDMIGRLRDEIGLEISGVGTAEGFGELISPMINAFPVKTHTLPGGSGPSDHASFYAAEIPVLAFFTGFHAEYHMPGDEFHTINSPGAVKVVNLVVELANMLAKRGEPLTYAKARGPSSARDLGADNNTGQSPARMQIRVQFGIKPGSYDDDKPGIPVADVTEGTSAAEAGIKAGDRMIRWNGEELADVQGWMRFLRAAKPGDIVHVVVIRGSEEVTIPVTLKARDNPGER